MAQRLPVKVFHNNNTFFVSYIAAAVAIIKEPNFMAEKCQAIPIHYWLVVIDSSWNKKLVQHTFSGWITQPIIHYRTHLKSYLLFPFHLYHVRSLYMEIPHTEAVL